MALLPFVGGSVVYWLLRKLTADDVESHRRAAADLRHSGSARSFDSARTGA